MSNNWHAVFYWLSAILFPAALVWVLPISGELRTVEDNQPRFINAAVVQDDQAVVELVRRAEQAPPVRPANAVPIDLQGVEIEIQRVGQMVAPSSLDAFDRQRFMLLPSYTIRYRPQAGESIKAVRKKLNAIDIELYAQFGPREQR